MDRPETILVDIDGCLIRQIGCMNQQLTSPPELLLGVPERFEQWSKKGNCIILLTARKESAREITEKQLQSLGLFWDQLIMGCTSGKRILINDRKSDGEDTAVAINLERNVGLLGEFDGDLLR